MNINTTQTLDDKLKKTTFDNDLQIYYPFKQSETVNTLDNRTISNKDPQIQWFKKTISLYFDAVDTVKSFPQLYGYDTIKEVYLTQYYIKASESPSSGDVVFMKLKDEGFRPRIQYQSIFTPSSSSVGLAGAVPMVVGLNAQNPILLAVYERGEGYLPFDLKFEFLTTAGAQIAVAGFVTLTLVLQRFQ